MSKKFAVTTMSRSAVEFCFERLSVGEPFVSRKATEGAARERCRRQRFAIIRRSLLWVCLLVAAVSASGQTAADGFKGDVNGQVYRVQASYDKVYIAGQQFTNVSGVSRSHLARLNHDGSLDTAYNPNPNGGLQGMAVSGVKLVVTGSFTSIGGGASGGIARLNYDGTNDGTMTAAISGAGAVAVQPDGKILVGGHFTTVGGVARNRLARFNADGTLDAGFAPDIDSAVFGITLQPDGKILLTGQFTTVNGQPRSYFARLNADGSLDTTISAGANGPTYSSAVQADGKIIIGGAFTRFGDGATVRNNLARLNRDGTPDSSFTPNFNGSVSKTLVQPDDKILVGGSFTTLNGAARNYIARLNRDGTVDASFVGSSNNLIFDLLTYADGRIVGVGAFTAINGIPSINRIARMYPDGRLDADTNVSVVGGPPVEMLSLPNGFTLIAGGFTTVGGATRQGMARLGWTGANDSTFANPQLTGGWATALAVQADGKYLVGGDFTAAGGTSQARLARFQPNGTIDGTFAPSFTFGASAAWVSSIAIQPDGMILAAGQFTAVNGIARTRIVRLNSLGQVDASFSAAVDFLIDVIALQPDGKILIGGAFENVGGQARAGIARLNANGTLDTSFNPMLNGIVREVADIKIDRAGKILIGGGFAGVNGNNRPNLARLNPDGTLDAAFSPDAPDAAILSIQLDRNGYIYIGGRFTNVGALTRPYIAMLNPGGSVNSLFQNTGASDNIQSMTIREDGKILVGGYFTSISGQSRNQFAALMRNNPPIYFMTATPAAIQWYRDGVAPEVSRVVFEHSADGVNYTLLGNAAGSAFPYYTWNLAMPPGTPSGFIRARGYSDFSDRRSSYETQIYYQAPQAAPRRAPYDFDGDGKTDISIFRPSDGSWWYTRSSSTDFRVYRFGLASDILAPGDFTGDGKSDLGVFRPSTGTWFIQRSEDNSFFSFPFGISGDIPAPADYDNDGKTDAAVFRPSNSTWYILNSNGSGTSIVQFGSSGDKPVPADYDGDGRADIAIFRPSDGSWWYLQSSNAQFKVYRFGVATDNPVPGDYTGDGRADIAVFRPSTGVWFVQRSEDNSFYSVPFGTNGDVPAPGDYDGDGKFDTAVFRPATGNWFVQRSSAGTLITTFGTAGDRPIPNAFVP